MTMDTFFEYLRKKSPSPKFLSIKTSNITFRNSFKKISTVNFKKTNIKSKVNETLLRGVTKMSLKHPKGKLIIGSHRNTYTSRLS